MVHLQVTLDYLLHLCRQGVSGVMAQHRISGLAFHFQLHGWENISRQFLICRTLRGWLKECGAQEAGIIWVTAILAVGVPQVCSSSYELSLFSTAFGLVFFGALLVSKLVPPSRLHPGGLLTDNLLVGMDSLQISCKD